MERKAWKYEDRPWNVPVEIISSNIYLNKKLYHRKMGTGHRVDIARMALDTWNIGKSKN